MKKAVFFGAGNIGRGFLGQLLTQGGYEVVFVDVDHELVDRLNAAHGYPLCLLSDEGEKEIQITNVRAVDGRQVDAVAAEIADADLLGTSVGAGALKFVAPTLAAGLRLRWQSGKAAPVDVLLCENLMDADHYLRGLLRAEFPTEGEKALLDQRVGLVETSIGRMVPVPSAETRRGNPLRVCAEPYAELPVDAAAFKGAIPVIPGLKASAPFLFFVHRKLFIHNMGHAVASYLGASMGYTWVWEAVRNPYVLVLTSLAMNQAARVLAAEHRADLGVLQEHVRDLLARFGNRGLADTIDRVCKDPLRKLSPQDRLVGALGLCRKHALESSWIAVGVAAALRFHTQAGGIDAGSVLVDHCALASDAPDHRAILVLLKIFETTPRPRLLESLAWSVQ